jgi:hypothetical protein
MQKAGKCRYNLTADLFALPGNDQVKSQVRHRYRSVHGSDATVTRSPDMGSMCSPSSMHSLFRFLTKPYDLIVSSGQLISRCCLNLNPSPIPSIESMNS